MNKIIILIPMLLLFPCKYSVASEIVMISHSELESGSDHIVLADVIKVVKQGEKDIVTIKIGKTIKGSIKKNEVSFKLWTRGGLKNFDPELKRGDSGVFFLKETVNGIEKAYYGSIALFPDRYFSFDADKK